MRSLRIAASVVVLCTALTANVANAQMTWNPPIGVWPGVMMANNQVNNTLLPRYEDNSSNNNISEKHKNASSSGASPRLFVPTYVPSRARTQANLSNFVARTRQTDAAQADKMQELFSSTDVIGQIQDVLVQFGVTKNNIADAYAVFWISSWKAANGDTSPPTAQLFQAVSLQAESLLAQNPGIVNADDATKQQMAEALLIQSALIDAHVDASKDNPAQQRAVANAATQGARAIGLDIGSMTLTNTGFQNQK